ncbi:unnamed protein product [Psylliodes chrysocephalus]|uniref:Beta-hexosaminidase n=1 Tax=Psylliodes chrysocephalus TaxID=3402493 RepID=A0A9P0D6B9_9CUCU|nr:unnamed protein product [Psylliodes chrysocephala]
MNLLIDLIATFLCVALVHGYIEKPGPRYPPTKGEVWPRPQTQIKNGSYFILKPSLFQFKLTTKHGECTLLKDAILRYELLIPHAYAIVQKTLDTFNHTNHKKIWHTDKKFLGNINYFDVELTSSCNDLEYPTDISYEGYSIVISEGTKRLNSTSVWGILKGLESFYQSIYLADDYLSLRINKTFIDDHPRYSHRGLLLDTSRHFIPLNKILLTIDAMSQNKLNVFHWHIVDDQSFPYVSQKFPELSEKGAYVSFYTYTPAQIQVVIEYARIRGIRVIPEFDTPGHTRSWGVAHPEILTACEGDLAGKYGPINPAREETYDFLNELFGEVKEVFADNYIHLGGDEVEFECWESNSNIAQFMKKHKIGDYNALESYYIQKVINLVDKLKYKSIVWEEVFNNGVKVPKETIVHVWKGDWTDTLLNVTQNSYKAILSSCWYLDHLDSGGDWESFYYCEPNMFSNDTVLQSRLIGGEACMWSEVVDTNNVISRIWPRASATAERLWTEQIDDEDFDVVRRRLEEHTCRMNRRGIEAQPPNGPGFCVV